MKIIYSCYWGSYLAVVTASLHLGYLNPTKFDDKKILALPRFGRINSNDLGKLLFVGTDNKGIDVYIIGSRGAGQILKKTLCNIVEIYGHRRESIAFVDLNNFYDILLIVGSLMAKNRYLHKVGIRLIVQNIKSTYKELNSVILRTKKNIKCVNNRTWEKSKKIFYCCYGGAHSSVVAASIHLGLLPMDRIPVSSEFKCLPHYDKTESHEIGIPFFMGKDEYCTDVYILGMANQRSLVKKAILSFLMCLKVDPLNLRLVDTLDNVNLITKIGGFFSRKLGMVKIGRLLTIIGIKQKYWDFVRLVANVKKKEEKGGSTP